MTQEQAPDSLITDEMRASIGKEGPPTRLELDKTAVRMFARAVGHTDPKYFDEAHAQSLGHRSIVAPPGYLGTPVFSPNAGGFTGPGVTGPGGRVLRALNGGSEYEYTFTAPARLSIRKYGTAGSHFSPSTTRKASSATRARPTRAGTPNAPSMTVSRRYQSRRRSGCDCSRENTG